MFSWSARRRRLDVRSARDLAARSPGLIYGSALRSGARVTTDEHVGDRLDDEARGDRRAVVMQDRHEPGRVDLQFGRQQGAHLLVAVLLDDEDALVIADEIEHVVMEREGADAQRVEMDAARFERVERLFHRQRRRAEIDRAELGRLLARRA